MPFHLLVAAILRWEYFGLYWSKTELVAVWVGPAAVKLVRTAVKPGYIVVKVMSAVGQAMFAAEFGCFEPAPAAVVASFVEIAVGIPARAFLEFGQK